MLVLGNIYYFIRLDEFYWTSSPWLAGHSTYSRFNVEAKGARAWFCGAQN